MASEQELSASAAAHAKKTTISWPEYLRRVQTQPDYAFEKTEWFRAGADLERVKHLPPPLPAPTPPPPAGLVAQNIVYVSDTPAQALKSPAHYALAFSADPAYQDWRPLLGQARAQGRRIYVWCDCRTTLPDQAKRLAFTLALDGWSGQAESDTELRVALDAEAPLIVGNANAWAPDSIRRATALIERGQLSFTQEAYTNCGNPWPEQTSAAGVPAASLCLGLYDASHEQPGGRYVSVDDYRAHTQPALWPTVCVYVSGLHPGELEKLP